MSGAPVAEAFEQLGLIRERLTKLQDVAADIEDPTLSKHVRAAMQTNTAAMNRAHHLIKRKTTAAAEPDLDSQQLDGGR